MPSSSPPLWENLELDLQHPSKDDCPPELASANRGVAKRVKLLTLQSVELQIGDGSLRNFSTRFTMETRRRSKCSANDQQSEESPLLKNEYEAMLACSGNARANLVCHSTSTFLTTSEDNSFQILCTMSDDENLKSAQEVPAQKTMHVKTERYGDRFTRYSPALRPCLRQRYCTGAQDP